MKTYSTKQAARLAGIHWITLHRWVTDGKVGPSQAIPINGRKYWRWTVRDVKTVREHKAAHYRKGRGRKKKKT